MAFKNTVESRALALTFCLLNIPVRALDVILRYTLTPGVKVIQMYHWVASASNLKRKKKAPPSFFFGEGKL